MKKYIAIISAVIFVFTSMAYSAEVTKMTKAEKDLAVNIIARTLLFEGRSDGSNGMYAVACIIQIRAQREHMPLADYCLKRKIFSMWNNVSQEYKTTVRPLKNTWWCRYAVAVATRMVDGEQLDHSFVAYCDHYCTLDSNPYWAKGQEPRVIIGNHKFYKLFASRS